MSIREVGQRAESRGQKAESPACLELEALGDKAGETHRAPSWPTSMLKSPRLSKD